jgi:hypothetical protein
MPLPAPAAEPPLSLLRFRGSAFMENRDEPVHRWIPWIAGFSTAFVEDCLTAFLPRRSASGVRDAALAAPKSGGCPHPSKEISK